MFSVSSVSSLYATWTVPAGVAAPCGRHLWGDGEYNAYSNKNSCVY